MTSRPGTFFDEHQRRTIEAAMARIIPTDSEPGAREAGTIEFLDRYLSGIDYVYAKPDGSGFERLDGRRAEAWRQRIDIVRAKYIEGVTELDRRSQVRFGEIFVHLTGEQQDGILTEMELPATWTEHNLELAQVTDGYGAPVEPAMQQTSAEVEMEFFPLLALHTRQGFYADPIYGGNKDHVGWRLIGFEGPHSLADAHAGRYTSRPFFAEDQIDWEQGDEYGG
ncbi:MAG TPA: gluconate 2-dehydrogenase subunit 3 family protein [Thermomicrobiales bacterium]|nr:gluconate 2-dehydrogenase subunit 3 family protein [Thermomicrobiales bacterium]